MEAAHGRGECQISPVGLKHQGFILLYSLVEGCHEVEKLTFLGKRQGHTPLNVAVIVLANAVELWIGVKGHGQRYILKSYLAW